MEENDCPNDDVLALQRQFEQSLWMIPFEGDLRRFLGCKMDDLKRICEAYGAPDTSCCIKLIVDLGQRDPLDRTVSTFARDSISEEQRRTVDRSLPSFKVRDNTAFREVCTGQIPYFLCNDLSKTTYTNANPSWVEFYNATLVVPIVASALTRPSPQVLGLICVDNLEGGLSAGLTNFLRLIGLELSHLFSAVRS